MGRKHSWPCMKGFVTLLERICTLQNKGQMHSTLGEKWWILHVIKIMMKFKWLPLKSFLGNSSWLSPRAMTFLASGSCYWQLIAAARRKVSFLQWTDAEYINHTPRQALGIVAAVCWHKLDFITCLFIETEKELHVDWIGM